MPKISVIRDNITSELASLMTIPKSALIAANGKAFKVLIVDDEPVNRQVLFNNLSLYNYEITEASNGQEALAARFSTLRWSLGKRGSTGTYLPHQRANF